MRVRYLDPGHPPEWVEFVLGTMVPRHFLVELTEHEVPHAGAITVEVTVPADMVPRCDSIAFTAKPGESLSTASLRELPMDRLLRQLAMDASRFEEQTPDWVEEPETALVPLRGEAREQIEKHLAGRRRHRIDESFLRQVADIYQANPDAPTRAVGKQLHGEYSTAARWVSHARARGFLPPTTPGKATR